MMLSLDVLQREAEHSYSIYLKTTDILNEPQVKLTLLKWVDACGTAVRSILNPSPANHALLWKELEFVTVQPIKLIYDSVVDYYFQTLGKKVDEQPWYNAPSFEEAMPDAIALKNHLIAQINLIFTKLKEATGKEFTEIKTYDHSNS